PALRARPRCGRRSPCRAQRSSHGLAAGCARERLANAAAPSLGPGFTAEKPEGPDMTTSAIATAPYEDLAAAVRGSLILPGDPEYDQARAVYNGMIDKHPAAIARCRDVADVITCVRFAREHGVEIAVRSGGHSAAGLGVWDGALVIDLSLLRSTTVSPENHTVRVDAGCTWETSTTQPLPSAWPPPPASCPPPGWPG